MSRPLARRLVQSRSVAVLYAVEVEAVRNTNRNWHTLGQGIETSWAILSEEERAPNVWPCTPIAKYPVPGPYTQRSQARTFTRTRGSVRTYVND